MALAVLGLFMFTVLVVQAMMGVKQMDDLSSNANSPFHAKLTHRLYSKRDAEDSARSFPNKDVATQWVNETTNDVFDVLDRGAYYAGKVR